MRVRLDPAQHVLKRALHHHVHGRLAVYYIAVKLQAGSNPRLSLKLGNMTSSMSTSDLESKKVVSSCSGIDVGIESQLIDLLPSFGVLVDPNTNTRARTHELAEPLIINLDLVRLPAQDIRPQLANMFFADKHLLLARGSIGQDTSQTIFAIMGATPHKAQAICIVIKVIVLVTVGEQLARQNQLGQFAATRRRLGMLALDAVEVAVKDTRIALVAQQNKRVRERFEESLDRCRDRLARLRIMVHDHGDGAIWLRLDKTLVKDLAQIGVLCGRELREVVE